MQQGRKFLLLLLPPPLRRLLQMMMMLQLLSCKLRWLQTGQRELGGVQGVRLLRQLLLQLSQQQRLQADANAGRRVEQQSGVLAVLKVVAARSWF